MRRDSRLYVCVGSACVRLCAAKEERKDPIFISDRTDMREQLFTSFRGKFEQTHLFQSLKHSRVAELTKHLKHPNTSQ